MLLLHIKSVQLSNHGVAITHTKCTNLNVFVTKVGGTLLVVLLFTKNRTTHDINIFCIICHQISFSL